MIKLTAICTQTSVEATIIAPKNAVKEYIEKLAVKKLEMIKAKFSYD